MSTRRKIQLLLWAYFWLVIFEGALRKWVFPGLSTPLLIVRDPVALMAVIIGFPYLIRRPWAAWLGWLWSIGVTAFFLALVAGHQDMITAAFGARIWIFHFPLIFLFAAVFARDDIWRFVKVLALVAIPMAVLIGLQYSVPQSHWLNVAPGGEGSAGFAGALGKYRPPGTFSFTNGLADFFALAGAGVAAWALGGPKPLPKWFWLSVVSLLAALPISISRSLLFKYALTGLASIIASILSGRQIKQFIYALVMVVVLGLAVSRIPTVQNAQEAFDARWEAATEVEGEGDGIQGVLQKRVGGGTIGSLSGALDVPLLGHGIGLGTNIGAMRISNKRTFLIAEGSWPATIAELGPILGLALISLRVALAAFLLARAWPQARRGNNLPLVLSSFAIVAVATGLASQPTALGFIVLGAGLTLAACNPTLEEMRRRPQFQAGRRP